MRLFVCIVEILYDMAYEVRVDKELRLRTFKDDPVLRRRMNEIIAQVLWEARNKVSGDMEEWMMNSQHEAFRAVHNSVYKRVMGGNINILTQRKALRRGSVAPSFRGRSKKTEQMLSYIGPDRGMILRWINGGTRNRYTVRMDGHPMYRNSVAERPKNRHYVFPNKLGGRGGASKVRTVMKGVFMKSSQDHINNAAEKFVGMVDSIIDEMFI